MKEGEITSQGIYGPYIVIGTHPYCFKSIIRIDGKPIPEELGGRYTGSLEVKRAIQAYHNKMGLPQVEGDLEFSSPFDTQQEREYFTLKLNNGKGM